MRDLIRKFAALPILGLLLAPGVPEAALPAGKVVLGDEWAAEDLRRAYQETFHQSLPQLARGAMPRVPLAV